MPRNADFYQSVHFGQYGDPDTFNQSSLPNEGELGAVAWHNRKRYQLVKTDSHQYDSSTTPGPVAANQLAFWKDKSNYVITNDSRVALGGPTVDSTNSAFRNQVAGVYRAAITGGNYCFILQEGININVKSTDTSMVVGDMGVANTGTVADAVNVAAATALTVQALGRVATVGDGTNVGVDLNIPSVP